MLHPAPCTKRPSKRPDHTHTHARFVYVSTTRHRPAPLKETRSCFFPVPLEEAGGCYGRSRHACQCRMSHMPVSNLSLSLSLSAASLSLSPLRRRCLCCRQLGLSLCALPISAHWTNPRTDERRSRQMAISAHWTSPRLAAISSDGDLVVRWRSRREMATSS